MLSPADATLATRDPQLPGLPLLLDDHALAALLGGPVVRRYLRYKPGTSCVLAAVLADGCDVAVQTVADDGIASSTRPWPRPPSAACWSTAAGWWSPRPTPTGTCPRCACCPVPSPASGCDPVACGGCRASQPGASWACSSTTSCSACTTPSRRCRPGCPAPCPSGAALAGWHAAHRTTTDPALGDRTASAQVEALLRTASAAPAELRAAVECEAPGLAGVWTCGTVVHRDLYEEQVLVAERLGLVDLDDAARGPAELDLGNALAHLHLRALHGDGPDDASALLCGYVCARDVDASLLARCTRLALLRLACLHREPRLLDREAVAA